ncbi:MAG: mechanosensitive ion channel domain-containing protein [Wenzhouxiangella sp.]|jgi:small-conductance mechanosensitive channel|nr:mechanosensitive ion channel domain-containing protein [Wenzhouxiangella sp.]
MDRSRALTIGCVLCLLVLPSVGAGAQGSTSERWFQVDALNTGLEPAPSQLDRSTPRQTVIELRRLTQAQADRGAAHLLNLQSFPAHDQADRGLDLARKLDEVISRTMVVDWSALPDRPDALLERSTADMPLAGEARRSLGLSVLELDDRPAEIRLNRIKPADGAPVWVFSSQTVQDIESLYQRYGPGWLEERLPASLQRSAVLGTRLWEWLALPLLIGLLVGLGRITYEVLGWLGRHVRFAWINRAADRVRGPLTVALMAILAQLLTGWVISFSGFFYTIFVPLLLGLTIVGFTVAALRSIDATLERITERFVNDIDDSSDKDRRKLYTSIYALRRFVLLVAVLISVALFVAQLRIFDNIGLSLLASAGVITVILGIAGRTVLGNILASLQIAISKPVRIGDAVHYEGQWGYVESIYYSFLVLRTWDGRRQIVPVQYFISYPFENWSMVDASITQTITLKLDHAADPAKLRKAFEKLVKKDERALDNELLMTAVTDHSEHFQELTFFATAANPSDAWLMQLHLREAVADWIRRYHPEWWPIDRLHLERQRAS